MKKLIKKSLYGCLICIFILALNPNGTFSFDTVHTSTCPTQAAQDVPTPYSDLEDTLIRN